MKTHYPYLQSALVLVTSISLAQAQTVYSLSGTIGIDSNIYLSDPSNNLFLSNLPSFVPTALMGDSTNAGGNIELFAQSDSPAYDSPLVGGAFQSATPISLIASCTSCGVTTTIRSLNGNDWFNDSLGTYNLSYGSSNLANDWFNDFLSQMAASASLAPFIIGNEAALFDSFRDNGGFAQLSDPNISYVDLTGSDIEVGLAGFLDAKPRVVDLLTAATGQSSSFLSNFVPDDLQLSEVVIIDGEAYYEFSASPSGVIFNDGVGSYSGTYEITVSAHTPEPSSALLLALGACGLLGKRRR